jgi:hypothetical protein
VDASIEVADENEDAGSEVDVESERKWGMLLEHFNSECK